MGVLYKFSILSSVKLSINKKLGLSFRNTFYYLFYEDILENFNPNLKKDDDYFKQIRIKFGNDSLEKIGLKITETDKREILTQLKNVLNRNDSFENDFEDDEDFREEIEDFQNKFRFD